MRTTVTLDKDVERLLHDAMHRSRKSFKQTLNEAVRMGLSAKNTSTKVRRFVLHARPMGLRAGIDPVSFNRLTDDIEVDAFLEKMPRGGKS